ncbi:MAG: hypothetical protein L0H84_23515 [Pseudonocardia sp.]|nr:hypothetical protein [Pseudonocardia sp.]
MGYSVLITLPQADPPAGVAASVRSWEGAGFMTTISTEDSLAVAVVGAIHAGDLRVLRQLLIEQTWLATIRIGDDDPEGMSRTLLHVATDWPGHFPLVEAIDALLDAGADIEAPGAVIGGGTPMADARAFKQWAAARRLIERGAQTTLADVPAMAAETRWRSTCSPATPI